MFVAHSVESGDQQLAAAILLQLTMLLSFRSSKEHAEAEELLVEFPLEMDNYSFFLICKIRKCYCPIAPEVVHVLCFEIVHKVGFVSFPVCNRPGVDVVIGGLHFSP